ncbi:hypothetical protein Tco_0880535, partial [Tanacetum coccineum]
AVASLNLLGFLLRQLCSDAVACKICQRREELQRRLQALYRILQKTSV